MPSLIADGSGEAALNLPSLANRTPSENGHFQTTSKSPLLLGTPDSAKSSKNDLAIYLSNGTAGKVDKGSKLATSDEGIGGREHDRRYRSSNGRWTSNLTNGYIGSNINGTACPASQTEPHVIENSVKDNWSTNKSTSSEIYTEKALPVRTDNDHNLAKGSNLAVNTEASNLATSSRDNMLLQVPASTYRSSSPPVLSTYSHAQRSTRSSTIPIVDAPSSSLNGRLTNRHTLDTSKIPGIGIMKSSTSPSHLEDTGSLAGRFSTSTFGRPRASMVLTRKFTRSINSDAHLDDVAHDEDAPAWADHKRQKRASRRKRKEEEDDDRVVVGTKVDQNHVNWVTAYNMLTGIRFTVSRTNAKLDRDLTDADFAEKTKFSFDM